MARHSRSSKSARNHRRNRRQRGGDFGATSMGAPLVLLMAQNAYRPGNRMMMDTRKMYGKRRFRGTRKFGRRG